MSRRHIRVVIVGAGPTGATAAIMLGQLGISCLVLERWPQVYPLPRAVHFDDEVFRIFAGMGLEQQISKISRPAPGMRLTDDRHRVVADFRRDPNRCLNGFPQANMFDQPVLEAVLRDEMGRTPGIEFLTNVEVIAIDPADGVGPVVVTYQDVETGETAEVEAEAVLGCDGANSRTRAVIGAELKDLGFEQQWLVVDADTVTPVGNYDGVQQVCDHAHPATFMRVVDGRYRWEFRLRPGEGPEDFDDAAVANLIRPWLEPCGLDAADPTQVAFVRRTCYNFRGVVANRWRSGRIFLLGDAAHQTPPFIGQGMCAGVRDAANLSWKLALVFNGQADDGILDTYETERRPHVKRVIQLAILIGRMITGGSQRTAPLRRTASRMLSRVPGSERRATENFWPAFPHGPLALRERRRTPAGLLCPNDLLTIDGQDRRLDEVLGRRFGIVYRSGTSVDGYEGSLRRWFNDLDVAFISLDRLDLPSPMLDAFLDEAGVDAVLIRPDRIVMDVNDRPNLRTWRKRLMDAGVHGLRFADARADADVEHGRPA